MPTLVENGPMKKSPCHGVKINMSRGDGVNMGSCSKCHRTVVRINPRSFLEEELLKNESPWTQKDAPGTIEKLVEKIRELEVR